MKIPRAALLRRSGIHLNENLNAKIKKQPLKDEEQVNHLARGKYAISGDKAATENNGEPKKGDRTPYLTSFVRFWLKYDVIRHRFRPQ